MLVWQQTKHGEPEEVLERVDVADIDAAGDEVLIAPEVVGISVPDLLLCRGAYQTSSTFPFTVGGEVAGTVLASPPNSGVKVGARVMATGVRPGGLAELVAADLGLVDPVPDSVAAHVAATIPVNYVTAHLALHHRAGLAEGETVLVNGGAGGVGSAAVQLALAHGSRVIATAVDAERLEACRSLGAHVVIDASAEDVPALVLEVTDGVGADVVIDPVGGDAFDDARRCIAFEGRIVVVGFVAGRIARLQTNQLVLRTFSAVGVNNGEYMKRRPEVHREARRSLLKLAATGEIAPLVAGTWPFDQAPHALTALAAGQLVGKALVEISTDH